METIGSQNIYSYGDNTSAGGDLQRLSNGAIRSSRGHIVTDYMSLAKKIAALQYRNRDYVLMLRGQGSDYRNRQKFSSIRPSIFRPGGSSKLVTKTMIERRFDKLKAAEGLLVERYKAGGFRDPDRIERHRLLRWAILQHYEICSTPLLDVTHSLRVAASFASAAAKAEAFIMVLGIPQISGGVSASAEAELVAIRLASVCPPEAVRPHIQEGYLLGEYPELSDWSAASLVKPYEVDFGLRLIAKFRFDPKSFWGERHEGTTPRSAFPQVPRVALFPSAADDPLRKMADEIDGALSSLRRKSSHP